LSAAEFWSQTRYRSLDRNSRFDKIVTAKVGKGSKSSALGLFGKMVSVLCLRWYWYLWLKDSQLFNRLPLQVCLGWIWWIELFSSRRLERCVAGTRSSEQDCWKYYQSSQVDFLLQTFLASCRQLLEDRARELRETATEMLRGLPSFHHQQEET
jgi:hypothetical protein